MDPDQKKLLMQARVYRLLGRIFMFTGLFVFILLYLQNIEGRLLEAMREPITVIIIVFPFIPAFILSLLAKSSEKKYLANKKKEQEKS